MAISESNLSSTSQLLTSNINKSHSANARQQASGSQSGSSDTFTSVLNAQQLTGKNAHPVAATNSVNNISNPQQSLFSSLGLAGGESGGDMLEKLTSDSSIEALQATLLTALQMSLLSPKPTPQSNATNGAGTGTNGTHVHNGSHTHSHVNESHTHDNTVTACNVNIPVNSDAKSLERLTFGDNGLELNDGFDIINVLNHIPGVSAVYQEASGQEQVSALSKLAGGFLYGGALGMAFAGLDLAVDSYSGSSINEKIANFEYSKMFDFTEDKMIEDKVAQDAAAKSSVPKDVDVVAQAPAPKVSQPLSPFR
ncbi:hypothetical protein KO527_19175 [Pseudoalteromonas sp. C2R02]|uniref:hypothetical protein n=1 Tax=Pseudoalteromonas sp. C2R02 TaxID=2841565 RepID=UPI001C099E89|nr:hypothetical protein [Pseudoalteromonas sp. C2R02]MBU2971470.1 hypothetical protein [Pseudoalteromonas sp. C2R02]